MISLHMAVYCCPAATCPCNPHLNILYLYYSVISKGCYWPRSPAKRRRQQYSGFHFAYKTHVSPNGTCVMCETRLSTNTSQNQDLKLHKPNAQNKLPWNTNHPLLRSTMDQLILTIVIVLLVPPTENERKNICSF